MEIKIGKKGRKINDCDEKILYLSFVTFYKNRVGLIQNIHFL